MFDAAAVRAAVVATGAGSRFFTDAVDGAAARGVGEARVVDGVAPVRSRCCSSRRGIDRPRVASAASASDAVNARMSARMSAVARRLHLVMAGAPIGGGAESKSSSRRARWVRRVPAGRRGMDVPTRLATLSTALDEAATSVEGERARRCERRGARSGPSAAASAGHSWVGCNSFSQPKLCFGSREPVSQSPEERPPSGAAGRSGNGDAFTMATRLR